MEAIGPAAPISSISPYQNKWTITTWPAALLAVTAGLGFVDSTLLQQTGSDVDPDPNLVESGSESGWIRIRIWLDPDPNLIGSGFNWVCGPGSRGIKSLIK